MAYEEATSVFLELSNNPDDVSEECLRKLERFVILLYDRTSTKTVGVNEAHEQLFPQKAKSIESIPPTQAVLIQHTRRAAYQAGHCWGQAIVPVKNVPGPSNWDG